MKLTKFALVTLLASVAISQAATITVAQGFGASQGLTVSGLDTEDGWIWAAGTWNAELQTFNVFADPVSRDLGTKVGGAVTAVGPASFNSQIINLFVGNRAIDAGEFIIFRTNSNTAFPPDVSAAGNTSFNAALGSNLAVVHKTDGTEWSPDQITNVGGGSIVFIPEPSVALLGAFGLLGLLRRRR